MNGDPCPRCQCCPDCRGRGVIPPEKVCANERCGKTFRFQDGTAQQDQYRTAGVIYCSRLCARAQVQRQSRRRKAGKPYLVGEHGPEVFVPHDYGTIDAPPP